MLARDPDAPGKTRLGLRGARAQTLRLALLLDSLEAVAAAGHPVVVFVTPGRAVASLRARIDADGALAGAAVPLEVVAQADGDLGARMTHAMAATLARGHDAVVLVGSDAPDLPTPVVAEALDAVSQGGSRRVVLGPAEDGGFFLVAARESPAGLFDGMTWSRPDVLAAVMARARATGVEIVLVRRWRDVDTADDLAALTARTGAAAKRTREELAADADASGGRGQSRA
jgi:hypothetical protein